MKNLSKFRVITLCPKDSVDINGGGPIKDGISWYFQTLGSFYRGIYDGLSGNEPA